MKCLICKKTPDKEKGREIFPCDRCQGRYCQECIGITTTELRVLQLKNNRVLQFACGKCSDKLKNDSTDILQAVKDIVSEEVGILRSIIDGQNEVIQKQSETLVKLLQEVSLLKGRAGESVERPTLYADKLKSNKSALSHEHSVKKVPVVIIRPNSPQDAKITREEIQRKISPKSLNVSIKSLAATKNGNLIITCNSEEEANKLVEEAQREDISSKYKAQLSEMKKPRIKIITTNQNLTKQEAEDCLRQQNDIITPDDYFHVTYINTSPAGTSSILAECSGDLFKRFMIAKRAFMHWERCPVYEDLWISRCRRCHAYDHKEKDCKGRIICSYCSEQHKSTDCPKLNKKCCNCLRSNEKYNLNHEIHHEASSRICPTYQYYLQRHKNTIDYCAK